MIKALLTLTLMHSTSWAHLNECGIYRVEGKVVQGKDGLTLLANRGTKSEVRIRLADHAMKRLVGVNVRGRMLIETACNYECATTRVTEVEPLSPFVTPASFRSVPESKMRCSSAKASAGS